MAFPLDLNITDWLFVALALIGLSTIILIPLQNSQKWKEKGVTIWGPIPLVIFLRTKRGLKLLDRLSRPHRLWRILASIGVPLVILSMVYFLGMVLLMAYLMVREPPAPSSYNAPRNILLIPGLNEYIPFVWGWIALFITMVVHEFAHGILSRVEGVRVKSMGIVTFLVAPIAAFVEPDEEELFGNKDKPAIVTKGARIRILSAGVTSNFIVAGLAMALFFGPVIGSISPLDRVIVVDVQSGSPGEEMGFKSGMTILSINGNDVGTLDNFFNFLSTDSSRIKVIDDNKEKTIQLGGDEARGIMVASIFENSPASDSGLPAKSIITQIDGNAINNLEGFRAHMNATIPGQTISLTTGDGKTYQVTLISKAGTGPAGFIGIGISGNAVYARGVSFQQAPAKQFLQVLKAIPSNGLQGFTYLLGLPFAGIPGFTQKGFSGFSGWLTTVFEPSGAAALLGGKFFWIANLLLWVGWINLYAALFNCLPAVPLDGGHIFRDLVQTCFERVVDVQEAEKLTRTVVTLLAWLVLTSLLITIVAPFTHSITF